MSTSRFARYFLILLAAVYLSACGGDGGSSSSDSKPPPTQPPVTPSPGDETPVARNDTATTTVNTSVRIVILANDTAVNDNPITVNIVTAPGKGTASVGSSGVVTYVPKSDVSGRDSFKYNFIDSKGVRSNQALVDITINQPGPTPPVKPPVNETPVARNDSASTAASSPVKIVVLANDTAVNDNPIKVNIVTAPTKGTTSINSSGVVTYTPKSGVTGGDSFRYDFTDSKGVRSNRAQVNITIACPAIQPHNYYLAIGDSITAGTGDDITSDNVTADGCYKGRGYPPVLVDKLNKAKGSKHTVVNKAVPGDRSLDGSRSVGGFLGGNSRHVLVLYGTNDANGAAAGNAVPAWLFKKNMKSIIDQIHSSGKNAYLAKIPPALGEKNTGSKYQNLDQGPRNQFVQEYNKVIDELVRENNINITPPDFYNYFKSRTYYYSDNVHLNGKGYQQMAELWFQKLRNL